MKKMQGKSKRIQIYKVNHKPPSNQAIGMTNTNFETQEDSNQNTSYFNGKNYTPLETKANKNKHQTQTKTSNPLEEENTKFYQLSLDKPQDKLRPLGQQGKSNPFQTRAWAILGSSLGHSIDTTSRNTCGLVFFAISKAQKGGTCN
jgi:hypothetical protein